MVVQVVKDMIVLVVRVQAETEAIISYLNLLYLTSLKSSKGNSSNNKVIMHILSKFFVLKIFNL